MIETIFTIKDAKIKVIFIGVSGSTKILGAQANLSGTVVLPVK